jgi:hypothetical protein
MADLTKTISVSMRVFGGGPSTKWGQAFGIAYTMAWGVSKWGEGGITVVFNAGKLIANTITPDSALSKSAMKVVSTSVSPLSDNSRETLESGPWKYVFVSDTTNAEERDPSTWSQGAGSVTSYACLAAGNTSWS